MNKTLKFALLGIAVIALLGAGAWYWQVVHTTRSTENAYINADIVQVASQVTGPVTATYVKEGELVKAGQPLFDIDPAPFKVALSQAEAQLAQAEQGHREDQTDVSASLATISQNEANLANAEASEKRIHDLVLKNYLSKQADDDARAKVAVAQAAVDQAHAKLAGAEAKANSTGKATPAVLAAQAAVAQAQLDLGHTHVVASKDGWIANYTLVPGTTVVNNAPLFSLIARGSFWVEANFKETELPGIVPGQPAEVRVDMLPDHSYQGVVDVIDNGTGAAFSLLPAQNATGNWVKVTQRVPVRIRLTGEEAMQAFRVGASAYVTIRIRG